MITVLHLYHLGNHIIRITAVGSGEGRHAKSWNEVSNAARTGKKEQDKRK